MIKQIKRVFSRAGKKRKGGATELLEAIFQERSDLKKQLVNGRSGGYSHVFIFEKEVFKGPASREDIPYVEQERDILRHTKGRGLPMMELMSESENYILFSVDRAQGVYLPKDAPLEIAGQIAGFIHGFAKAFTPEEAESMAKVRHGVKAPPEDLMNDPFTRAALGENLLKRIEPMMEEYTARQSGRDKIMLHSDLKPDNIFVHEGQVKVIDFNCVNIMQPEEALVPLLLDNHPRPFIEAVCEAYAQQGGQKFEYRDVLLCAVARNLGDIAKHAREQDVICVDDAKIATMRLLRELEKPAVAAVPKNTVPVFLNA